MNEIDDFIQNSNATGDETGLRFIPSKWDEDGQITGYDVITISDTMSDDLGATIKIRRKDDHEGWTVQIIKDSGSSPKIPCDSLLECWKVCMMWSMGVCEGKVHQSQRDLNTISGYVETSPLDDQSITLDVPDTADELTAMIQDAPADQTVIDDRLAGDFDVTAPVASWTDGYDDVYGDSYDDVVGYEETPDDAEGDDQLVVGDHESHQHVHGVRALMGWLSGLLY